MSNRASSVIWRKLKIWRPSDELLYFRSHKEFLVSSGEHLSRLRTRRNPRVPPDHVSPEQRCSAGNNEPSAKLFLCLWNVSICLFQFRSVWFKTESRMIKLFVFGNVLLFWIITYCRGSIESWLIWNSYQCA